MSHKINYLHLEDEQSIVDVTKRLLKSEGYEISYTHVQTRDAYLEAIENNDFDIVIADYALPEFDGLTALKLLRERNTVIPFILFSGSIGEEKAIKSLRNGATDYVLKQNITALAPAVKRALEESVTKKSVVKAAEELAISSARYQSLFEAAPDGVFVIDADGIITDCNNEETRICGYTREEIIGQQTGFYLDLPYKNLFKEEFLFLQEEGKLDLEVVIVHKNGDKIPVWRKVHATYNREGIFSGAVIYNRDISDLKENEDTRQNLGRILDDSLNEIFIFDAETLKFLQLNQGAKENLGYNENECCHLTPYGITPEFTKEKFSAVIAPLRNGTESKINFTTIHKRKDGSQYPVDIFLQPTIYAGKKSFVAFASDISERKRAEQTQQVMLDIASGAVNTVDDLQFYTILKKELNTLLDTSNFFIGFYEAETDSISFPYMEDEKDRFEKVPAANTMSSFVIRDKASLLLIGDEVDAFIHSKGLKRVGTPSRCWLGVPLITDDRAIGLIVVQSYDNPNAFNVQDKHLLEFVASQVASSIKRKQAESMVHQLSRSVEQSPVSTVITDLKGIIRYVNPKFCQITGYSYEEAIGQNPRVLKSGATPAEEYKKLWDTIVSGKVWRGRFHNKRKNGELFWEDATIGPIKNEQGETTHYLAVKEDITEKVEDEIRMKQLNRQNDILLATFPSVLMVMDAQEEVIRWNKKAAEVFKLEWEDVQNKHLHDLPLSWDWGEIIDGIAMSRDQKSTYFLKDVTFDKEEDITGFLNVTVAPFMDEEDIIDGYLIHAEDITDKKIAEGQQAHAQKLESIGQLAAGIAHEINTPAQYVGDNTHFLEDSFADLKRLMEVFTKMQKTDAEGDGLKTLLTEAGTIAEEIDLEFLMDEIPLAIGQSLDGIGKVSKIVKAMKEFSHPGGKDKTMVDLNRAIENTVTVSSNEWKYVADVKTELDDSLSAVPCFPDEFNQVVLNIIINAAHAIGDAVKEGDGKGIITIATQQREAAVEVRISDNGTGMPEDIRKKIFDPFFTTKDVGKGTGQGLAISHDVIVNKHGGTIEVESEQGKGTTFIISLPLKY